MGHKWILSHLLGTNVIDKILHSINVYFGHLKLNKKKKMLSQTSPNIFKSTLNV